MARAEFTGAIAFGSEVSESQHLLGYQNKAQSYEGPNCMMLHVPTGELSAENLIPTDGSPSFLQAIGSAVPSLFPVFRGGTMRGGVSRQATVVKYGAYDVVLASSAAQIPAALCEVEPTKRPVLNEVLLEWYDREYPDYSFVLACFNNAVEVAQDPILVSYVPHDPTTVFIPGLESHDGRPPHLRQRDHDRDFKVAFGSLLREEPDKDDWMKQYAGLVHYSDCTGVLEGLLPTHVVGFHDANVGVNDDYRASVSDIRSGVTGEDLLKSMPTHFKGSTFDR